MSFPDDIIFLLFDLMTPDEAIGYALTCNMVYNIWCDKLFWRKKLTIITNKKHMIDMIDNSKTPYKTFTFLKTGINLKEFNEEIVEINKMKFLLIDEIITNYWSNKLTKLNFSNCKLSSIPSFIGNITSLKQLVFEGNSLQSIPSSFKKLTNLEYLNLSNNKFQYITQMFKYLTNLKYLKMKHNSLTIIPSFIYDMNNLEELIVGYNQIRYIQNEIIQLTRLRVLELNNNMLTSIPLEISQMPNLKQLYLYRNKKLHIGTSFKKFYYGIQIGEIHVVPTMNMIY